MQKSNIQIIENPATKKFASVQIVQNTGMPFRQRWVVESCAGALIDAHVFAVLNNKNQVLWADKSIPLELEAAWI